RQNLYARLGLEAFVTFVHLAERRGEAQFATLARHFAGDAALAATFAAVQRDERFHVNYSGEILRRWQKQGRRRAVRLAWLRVRGQRVWDGWRRMGRRLGDVFARALLTLVYIVVVPLFSLFERHFGEAPRGWVVRPSEDCGLTAARRQF